MSNTTAKLRRKIAGASDLQTVVRAMKALAATNISQYENSMHAMADYYRSVEFGLGTCFRAIRKSSANSGSGNDHSSTPSDPTEIVAVVFGSDQGLVGQFNEAMVDYALSILATTSADVKVWAVGERVYGRLQEAGCNAVGLFAVPTSIQAITPLVGEILVKSEGPGNFSDGPHNRGLYLFYNRPGRETSYAPSQHRLLPLDDSWRRELINREWPSKNLPEVLGNSLATTTNTLVKLIREYIFVSLFRACAESLASENASRLSAMQRAEKNIEELLITLDANFRQLRQSSIDEELFDIMYGFEALNSERR